MKNKQEGSMAAVVAVTVTTLGLTALTIQNYRSSAKNTVTVAEMKRDYEKKHEESMNAASRFKSLVAPSNHGGRYYPGILATNYFDAHWSLKHNGGSNADLTKSDAVSMSLAGNPKEEMSHALKVFGGASFSNTNSTQAFQVQIKNVNRDNASAMELVTSLDIQVTTNHNGKPLASSYRLPMAIPEARNPTLKYRAKGSGSYQPVTSDLALDAGTYEFQAYGSGIVYYANLIKGTVEHQVGWSKGVPTHHAVSWDSEDQPIGDPVEITVGEGTAKEDIKFDASSCSESGTAEDVTMPTPQTIRMQVYGVDGKLAAGSLNDHEFTISTSATSVQHESQRGLSASDYQTVCSAQCPYYGEAYDPAHGPYAGDAIGYHFVNEVKMVDENAKAGDMSSAWNYQEAARYGISKKKLCFNLDGPGVDYKNDPEHYFEQGNFFAYTPGSCRRQFVMERTNCGCVSEDTKILMGDGRTEKRIDQISEGESVWNPVMKKAMPIHHLSRGPEKVPLLTIHTAGLELNATGNHPFPTHQGMKTAFQLEAGEEIQLANGSWVKIESVAVQDHKGAKAPIVWNIEIDAPRDNWDAHHYVANGIDTGDLYIQRTIESGRLSAQK